MLGVQVLRTLAGFAVLVDGGQVDRLQAAHAAVDLGDGLLPFADVGDLGQRVDDVLQHEATGHHRFRQLLGLQRQRLLVQLALGDALALGQRLLVALLAGLFVLAQFVVDAFQQRPRFGQLAVGGDAVFQRRLPLRLQFLHRRIAFVELQGEFFQARVQLAALAAHAVQGLAQRDDLRPLRLQGQRQRVHGIARTAGGFACLVARLDPLATLVVQRLPCGFQIAHAGNRIFKFRSRFAGLLAAGLQRFDQLRDLAVDAVQTGAGGFQLALVTLQLAGQLGHAAMRHVQRALRFFALLLGSEQLVAQLRQAFFQPRLARLQGFDLATQRLDLALAQQRALLRRTGAQHAHPAGAQAFAVAGDDGIALAQLRLQATGLGQVFGHVQAGQQATDRRRALHLGRQRGRRERHVATIIGDQRDAAIAELAQRLHQRFRGIDQHAFDQLAQRAFDGILPARFDGQLLADARRVVQAAGLQPGHGGALFLAQRGVLQGFQRRQPAAGLLRALARVGQFGLGGALLLLGVGGRLLAGLDLFAQRLE